MPALSGFRPLGDGANRVVASASVGIDISFAFVAERERLGADAATPAGASPTDARSPHRRSSGCDHAGTGCAADTIGRYDTSDHYGFRQAPTETDRPCAATRSRTGRDAYASVAL
jgi:hypothetical protein